MWPRGKPIDHFLIRPDIEGILRPENGSQTRFFWTCVNHGLFSLQLNFSSSIEISSAKPLGDPSFNFMILLITS